MNRTLLTILLFCVLILITPNPLLEADEPESVQSPLHARTIGESVDLDPLVEWKQTGAVLGKSAPESGTVVECDLDIVKESFESRLRQSSEMAFATRYKIASGHVKVTTKRQSRHRRSSFQIVMWAKEKTRTLRFSPSPGALPRPRQELTDLLADKKYYEAREQFGTHYISAITYGRCVMVVIDVRVRKSSHYDSIKQDLGIAADAAFWSVSANASFEEAVARYANLCDFKMRVFCEGGGGISDITAMLGCDYRSPKQIRNRLQNIFSELDDDSPAIIDIEAKALAHFDSGYGDWLSLPWRAMRLKQAERRLRRVSDRITQIHKLIDCGYEPNQAGFSLFDSLEEHEECLIMLLDYMNRTRKANDDPHRLQHGFPDWSWKEAFCPHCGEPIQEPMIRCYCWSRSDEDVVVDENSGPLVLEEGVNEFRTLEVTPKGRIMLPPTKHGASSIPVIAVRGDFILNGQIQGRRGLHHGCVYSRNWVYCQSRAGVNQERFEFEIKQNEGGFGGPGATPGKGESTHGQPHSGSGGGGGSDHSNNPFPAEENRGGHGALYEQGNKRAGRGGNVVTDANVVEFDGQDGTDGKHSDSLGGGGGARGGHGQCVLILCRRYIGTGTINLQGWNGGDGGDGGRFPQDGSTGGGGGGGAGGSGGMAWVRFFDTNHFCGTILTGGGSGGKPGKSSMLHGNGNGDPGKAGKKGSYNSLPFCTLVSN